MASAVFDANQLKTVCKRFKNRFHACVVTSVPRDLLACY